MYKFLLISMAITGTLAVVIGAFGAHGVKPKIQPDQFYAYETGVRYMFYHVFAMLAAILLYDKTHSIISLYGGLSFLLGIVLFSGSLFLLSTREITHIDWSWIGPVTPVGGFFLVIGWVLLLFSIIKGL